LCATIPFIIVSGVIGEEKAVELIKMGVTDYAVKDKLFTLVPKIERGIKDANEAKERLIVQEQLRIQSKNLSEIAFLQSHQVRGPIVQILSLFSLFNFKNVTDQLNVEVFCKLKTVAESFEKIAQEIVKKTKQIDEKQLGVPRSHWPSQGPTGQEQSGSSR
jgi:hypothetical protein